MEGLKVRCCTCRQVMYETTEFYNCHQPLTGDMLRLLPLYKDWPCYDGSLAVKSTSRFLMFCTACAGYISTTGKLNFADFHDVKVTVVSEERSGMPWWDPLNDLIIGEPELAILESVDIGRGGLECKAKLEFVDNLIISGAEDSLLVDEPKVESVAVTPKEMMEKLEKRVKTSRKKNRK